MPLTTNAIRGTVAADLINEPLGVGTDGRPVFLKDLWPSPEELRDALAAAKALYRHTGLSAKEIATEALRIAAEVDLYTSGQVTVLTLGEA